MVEKSWWLLGLQWTTVVSSAWQWLVGVGLIGDDGAYEVGCLSASFGVVVARRGVFVWSRV